MNWLARLMNKMCTFFYEDAERARKDNKHYFPLEHNESVVLYQVHDHTDCAGEPCAIHNRTEHSMRTWPQNWRDDRGIVERICEHGIGHPDPDQFEFWMRTNQGYNVVHGCDGCCIQSTSAVQSSG